MVEAYVELTSGDEKEISKWRDEEPVGSSQLVRGVYYKIYHFNTIVKVRELSYENNCLSLLYVDFSFIENDVF